MTTAGKVKQTRQFKLFTPSCSPDEKLLTTGPSLHAFSSAAVLGSELRRSIFSTFHPPTLSPTTNDLRRQLPVFLPPREWKNIQWNGWKWPSQALSISPSAFSAGIIPSSPRCWYIQLLYASQRFCSRFVHATPAQSAFCEFPPLPITFMCVYDDSQKLLLMPARSFNRQPAIKRDRRRQWTIAVVQPKLLLRDRRECTLFVCTLNTYDIDLLWLLWGRKSIFARRECHCAIVNWKLNFLCLSSRKVIITFSMFVADEWKRFHCVCEINLITDYWANIYVVCFCSPEHHNYYLINTVDC